MTDLPGQAIHDFYFKNSKTKLFVHDMFGPKMEMPVDYYFRAHGDMPEIEQKALDLCQGTILDIGAAAGSHTLELQNRGLDAVALDISPAACEVMKDRGIKKIICEDFFKFSGDQYDVLLFLMNGIGLSSTVEGFKTLLKTADSLLQPDGRIIFDSCDISYMYDGQPLPGHYFGEVKCRYGYGVALTDWFRWLYLDGETMQKTAGEAGWHAEIVMEDENDQYLAVLRKI